MKRVLLLSLFLSNVTIADDCTAYRQMLNTAIADCEAQKPLWPGRNITGFLQQRPDKFSNYRCMTTVNLPQHQALYNYWSPNLLTSCAPILPRPVDNQPNGCAVSGSIVEITNRVVGEKIPVIGAPFSLVYKSDRVVGRKEDYKMSLLVTGDYVSNAVSNLNIQVKDEVGTVLDNNNYLPLPNASHPHVWNGLDAASNETWGKIKRGVTITETASDYTFGPMSTYVYLGNLKAKKLGTGAWLPSIWHYYDTASQTLFKGDGTYREVEGVVVGGLTRVADASGKEVYYFNSSGKIVETKTGLLGTSIFTFTYDSAGQLLTISQPFGKVTTFTRNVSGVLESITAPNGAITNLTINSYGYLSSLTNPNSEVFTMTYYGTTDGLLHTFTKPNGNVTTLTYDSNGNLTNDVNSNGSSLYLTKPNQIVTAYTAENISNTYKYEPIEKIETVTNPYGFNTYYTRSELADTQSSPIFSESTRYRDDLRFGKQVKALRSYSIGNFGSRLTDFTHSVSLTTPSDPFSISTLSIVADMSPSRLTSNYTGSTKTWLHTTKLGRTYTNVIDLYERLTSFKKGNLTANTFTYTNNLLTKTAQGSLRETNYTYYTNGLLKDRTNALSEKTTYSYDSAQRLSSVTLPDLRVVNYSYDSDGNLTSITPPSRPDHEFAYGSNEKVEEYLPPTLSGVPVVNTQYTYNLDKKLKTITRPDGKVLTYNYNTTTGLLTSITGLFGSITNTYNYGLLATTQNQYGVKITNTYNLSTVSGTSLTVAAAPVYTYSRTPNSSAGGKMATEDMNGSGTGSVSQSVSYTYDQDEYLTGVGGMTLTYDTPNGLLTTSTLNNIKDNYTYNLHGEITQYWVKYGTTVIYQYDLTRDNLGRVTQKIELINGVSDTFNYVYDSVGRLTQVSKNSIVESNYVYDSNSNRTGGNVRSTLTNATYDDQDRLLSYNGVARTYNANGEALTIGTSSLDYDVFGNLINYNDSSNSVAYEVDPRNYRLGEVTNGVSTSRKRYISNPEGRILGELDYQNKLMKRYVYASKRHVPDFYIDSSGNKFRIITDYLGSVRLIVNSNTAAVSQQMIHDEFGIVLIDSNPGLTPFGFAGGLYSSISQLVRFGARDYDTAVGRWISKDPIRFSGGDANLYGYVLQDPVNFIDPKGTDAILLTVLAGGVIPHSVIGVSTANQGVIYFEFAPASMMDAFKALFGNDVNGGVKTSKEFPNSIILNSQYFSLTPEQDRMLLDRLLKNPGQYNILNNNCFSFTGNACANTCK